MSEFPFLYLNHGTMDAECLSKCEEIWLWFGRDVTDSERKAIAAACPPPVASFSAWDKRFTYFGSAGDSYDSEVLSHYGPAEFKRRIEEALKAKDYGQLSGIYQELYKHADSAAAAFSEALEAWVKKVHSVVPIAAFFGPRANSDDDEWDDYSRRNFARVMLPALKSYQPSAAAATCFGYIQRIANDYMSHFGADMEMDTKERAELLAKLESQYQSAKLRIPFSRLEYSSDHWIQEFGSQVLSFLNGLKEAERKATIEKLSPYSRLFYFASYSGDTGKDTERFGDKAAYTRKLVKQVPAEKAEFVPWLILYWAETIAHDSPAFDKKKRDAGAQAAKVLSVALPMADASAMMWGKAVRYLGWAGETEKAFVTAQKGLRRFPFSEFIAREAAGVAKKVKDAAAEKAFKAVLAKAKTLDPDVFVNRSAELANSGKAKEIISLFEAYLKAGGELTPEVMTNGLAPHAPVGGGHPPSSEMMSTTFPRLLGLAAEQRRFRRSDPAMVVLGVVVGAMPQHRPLFFSLLMPFLQERGAGLHAQLLFHHLETKNDKATAKVVSAIEKYLAVDATYLDTESYTLHNLAIAKLRLGDAAQAMAYLRRLKDINHNQFRAALADDDLKALRGLPEFKQLAKK